jgi:AraC-like DNA-binding protein
MSRLDRISDWAKFGRLAMYDCCKLAKLCLVSPTHLRRYFCARFHKPPQRLLNEMRLWDAVNLLSSSQLSVKDLARELFFANESQLCHQFKAYFGCTPSKFVQFHQNSLSSG